MCLTNITHGGSTKISSYEEWLGGISKSEISSFRLILWQLIYKPDFGSKLVIWLIWQNCTKVTHNRFLGFSFWFMGLGWFLSVDWSCACSALRSSTIYTSSTMWNWPHLCVPVWKSTRVRGWCITISCQCHGSVYYASMPACQRVIPEVSELPWMFSEVPEGQECGATVPDGSKPTRLYLWHNFAWNDVICIVYLSCDGLLAVGIVKESIYSLFRLLV